MHNKWVWLFAVSGVGAVLSATSFGLLPLFTPKAGWLIVGLTLGLSLAALAYPLFYFRKVAMRPASPEPVVLPPVPVQVQELTNTVSDGRADVKRREAELQVLQEEIDRRGVGGNDDRLRRRGELTVELAAERQKLQDAEEQLTEIKGTLSNNTAPQPPLRQQIRELKDELAQLQIDVRHAEGSKLSDLQNAAEARELGWGAQYENLRSSAEQWGIVKAHREDRLKDAHTELAELQGKLEAEQ